MLLRLLKLGDNCFEQRPDCVGPLRGPSFVHKTAPGA